MVAGGRENRHMPFSSGCVAEIHMNIAYQIVVCGGIVPDPLQTLEPVTVADRPGVEK